MAKYINHLWNTTTYFHGGWHVTINYYVKPYSLSPFIEVYVKKLSKGFILPYGDNNDEKE